MIQLAQGLTVGLDVVTQTLAAIGRKGAGKTYLATLLAEQMLDAGAQVVAIDPVGNWWGLRVGADGRSKGKDIFVLGGEHGDVPLVPTAGARVAQLLVDRRVSAILDVSGFRKGERVRFATDFAEELFHRQKRSRSPLHFFVEEAQKFIPQRVEDPRQLGAFEDIIRLGRNYGIGATLVTQRPQSVNKEVLSQVECLCVLQVTGLHERKALEAWVQEAGADRQLVGELPGLSQGEGFVWSPGWLRTYRKVRFGKKTTFDTSATPEVGRATKAATLSPVDVDRLRTDLEAVVKQAEADDPKALRRELVHLRKELAAAQEVKSAPMVEEKIVIRPALPTDVLDRFEKACSQIEGAAAQFDEISRTLFGEVKTHLADARAIEQPAPVARRPLPTSRARNGNRPATGSDTSRDTKTAVAGLKPVGRRQLGGDTNPDISRPQQRILDALAWLLSVGITEAGKPQLAFLAGASPKSSAFANNLGTLRSLGVIEYVSGQVVLTETGQSIAAEPEIELTPAGIQEAVLAKVTAPQQRILRPLIDQYPTPLHRDQLADLAEASPKSSAYANNLGFLRSLGLIDYTADRGVVAKPLLFLEA